MFELVAALRLVGRTASVVETEESRWVSLMM